MILTNTKYLFWGEEVRRGSDCEALRTRLWVYLSEAKNLGLYVEFRTPVFWGDGAHCLNDESELIGWSGRLCASYRAFITAHQ